MAESRRRPIPGSRIYTYAPGEAVWRRGEVLLSWCPEVTRNWIAEPPSEGRPTRFVTFWVGDCCATVPVRKWDYYSVWWQFPNAPGTATQWVRQLLARVINDQAHQLTPSPIDPERLQVGVFMPAQALRPAPAPVRPPWQTASSTEC